MLQLTKSICDKWKINLVLKKLIKHSKKLKCDKQKKSIFVQPKTIFFLQNSKTQIMTLQKKVEHWNLKIKGKVGGDNSTDLSKKRKKAINWLGI